MLSVSFLGGTGSVTGALFLFKTEKGSFLVDCGLAQGSAYAEQKNYEAFSFDPAFVDHLVVTHAHADHIGRIPKLIKDGFRGAIHSTPATKDLAAIMFDDALSLIASEARAHGHEPLYKEEHVVEALRLWHTHEYHTSFSLEDGVSAEFKDAGHILGSAMVVLERNKKRFLATGDLGNSPSFLLADTELLSDVDYILTESVYGDRVHEAHEVSREHLKEVLLETVRQKRTLLIPTFAIERTQTLLYLLNIFIERGEVPALPVFLDAPLAEKVTNIYRAYPHLFKKSVQETIKNGDDIFSFPQFAEVFSHEESERIEKVHAPKIILAGSGMSMGGRVIAHEAHLLRDKNATVLFVGYQSVGTLGRKILDGNKSVRIGEEWVRVHARIESISGFSAHKDRDGILGLIEHALPRVTKVFVAMGETKSSLFLTQRIRDFLGVDAVAPEEGDTVVVEF